MANDIPLDEYSVPLSGTLLDGVETISRNHSRCTIIIDDGKVVGILSEGDVLRAFLKGANVHAPIAKYFNPSFKFLTEFDAEEALRLIREHGITLIPLVDADLRLTGVVTWKDILKNVAVVR